MKSKFGFPLLLSFFGGFGLALTFLVHGSWFEHAKQLGLPEVVSLRTDLTPLDSLRLGLPFAILAFISTFVVVFASLSTETTKWPADVVFPSLTLLLVGFFGILGSFFIPGAFDWVNWFAIAVYGALCAWSHQLHLYLKNLEKRLSNTLSKVKDKEMLARRLELEHNSLHGALQSFIWVATIILTAGVVAGLLKPLEPTPKEILKTVAQNVFILGTWAIIGIWFGIINPTLKRTQRIRETIEEMALSDF
jgi:hypothetical protein